MANWNVFDPADGQNHLVEAPTGEAAKTIYRQQKAAGLQAEPATTLGGLAKAAASGLVRGGAGLAGLPGDAINLVDAGIRNAPRLAGYPAIPPGPKPELPTSKDFIDWFERDVTPLYQPQTTAESMVGKIGEYAPGIVAGPGGLARRAIQQVVAPAVGEETAGEIAHKYAPKYEPYARMVGALGGATVAGPGIQRALTPNPTSQLRVQRAQTLRNAGVNPTAGQETGNYRLQLAESELGQGGAPGMNQAQAEDFTSAVMAPVGDPGVRNVTPDVINANHARIGGVMDRLEARYTMDVGAPLVRDFQTTWQRYSNALGRGDRAPIVENTIRDIMDLAQQHGGRIPGDLYRSRRTALLEHARTASNADTRHALMGLREALDDAMERSMVATSLRNPNAMDDVRAWREARQQYANLMVVEDAMTLGQAQARGMGTISPQALATAAARGPRKKNFIRGRSDYTDLAHAGQAVLTPLPQSGTAGRSRIGNLLPMALGTAAGAALQGGGDLTHSLLLPALGAVGGAGLTAAAGKTLMHPWTQRYLRNQMLGPAPPFQPGRQMALTAGMYGPRAGAPVLTIGGDRDGMMTPAEQAAMRRRLVAP